MKIDRTRFLLFTATITTATALTGVITSTGCVTQNSDSDAGPSANTNDSGSSDDDGSTGDGGATTNPDADTDAATACLGGSADEGTLCGPATEGEDAGPDAGAVNCPYECNVYAARFKSEVAKAINDCMNLAPTCEGEGAACASDAIAKACPDPEAATACTAIVTTCGDAGAFSISQSACVAVLNATTPAGRAAFTSCADEGGCEACFNQLDALKNPF